MGLVIIFSAIAILAIFSLVGTIRSKNYLGVVFSAATILVFGWFTIMTLLNNGYPQ